MRLHRQWKRAISFLTSVVLTTVSIVPGISPLTAYAAGEDPSNVYVVGSDPAAELNEAITDESYYDNGTYTVTNLDDNGHYVKKQFEWVDPTASKSDAVITFEMNLNVDKKETTAVYSFTPCLCHGFSEEIARNNIEWMKEHYDHVDLIWYSGTVSDIEDKKDSLFTHDVATGIHIATDVQENDLYKTILNEDGSHEDEGIPRVLWDHYGAHWGISAYAGLYAYFKGYTDADMATVAKNPTDTVTMDNAVRKPTAIYTAFDGLLDSRWFCPSGAPYERAENASKDSDLSYPKPKYNIWPILCQYDTEKRYFSSGRNAHKANDKTAGWAASSTSWDASDNQDNLHYYMWNELLALMDPSVFTRYNKTSIPDDELWNGAKRSTTYLSGNQFKSGQCPAQFDYLYSSTFQEQGAKAVELALDETPEKALTVDAANVESVTWTAVPDTGADVEYTIKDGKVHFNIKEYTHDTLLTFKIKCKVDDENAKTVGSWFDVNSTATLTIDDEEVEITSPKAHLEGYRITTEVIGGTIDPSRSVREGGDVTINYAPYDGYELKSITVDGNEIPIPGEDATEEEKKVWSQYLFDNVQSDRTIKVVYVQYKDVTARKIWEDDSNKYGLRPTDPADLGVVLKADGTAVSVDPEITTDDQTDNNIWIFKWTHLPVTKDDGVTAITYTVEETNTPEFYKQSVDGLTITNTHKENTKDASAYDANNTIIELDDDEYVSPGEVVHYDIKYTNNSDNTANVIVTDALPSVTTYVEKSADPDAVYDSTKHTLTWTIPDVAAGAGGTVSFDVKVKDDVEPNTMINNQGIIKDGNKKTSETNKVTNKVKTGSATLSAEKVLEGRDWNDGEKFTLKLSGGTLKTPETKEVTREAPIATFTKIVYGKADIGKTYTYTISEDETALPKGVTKTSGDITATVVVASPSDAEPGKILTTVTYSPDPAEITNTYKAKGELDTEKTPLLIKKVEADGTDWAPKTFDFTIEGVDGAPLATRSNASTGAEEEITTGSATFTASGEKEKTVSFGAIQYTEPGDYVYKVKENKPETAETDAWTYDLNPYEVTVKVTDDGSGKLKATVVPKAVTVTNKYEPVTINTGDKTTAVLKKTVASQEDKVPETTFNFKIETVNNAPLPKKNGQESTTGSATFTQKGTQVIDFGTITYTEVG